MNKIQQECSDFLAHSVNHYGFTHSMSEHSYAVARQARVFASKWGLGEKAYFAGLLHDAGKCHSQNQKDLKLGTKQRLSYSHKYHGAVFCIEALTKIDNLNENKLSEVLTVALPISGHHGGVKDWDFSVLSQGKTNFLKEIIMVDCGALHENKRPDYKDVIKAFCESIAMEKTDLIRDFNNMINSSVIPDKEFYDVDVRAILSALGDADTWDTKRFYQNQLNQPYKENMLTEKDAENILSAIWKKQEYFAKNNTLNDYSSHKTKAYDTVLENAKKTSDNDRIMSIGLPTGFGKTFASFGAASELALKHKADRIIYVAPLIKIIDQTSLQVQEMVTENRVLTDHSSIIETDKIIDNSAKNTWNAPIIMTTAVNFWETLFSNKKTKLTKFHRLANSIIILDEPQSYPAELVESIYNMMHEISEKGNVRFILCSATLPSFQNNNNQQQITPLILKENLPAKKQRNVQHNLLELDKLTDLTKILIQENETNTAVILNTKTDCALLHRDLKNKTKKECLIYTTNLTKHDRRLVFDKIKKYQKEKTPFVLFSTQALETGVDLSFSSIYRIFGPLDSMVQAEGRAGRYGEPAQFTIFGIKDEKFWSPASPPTYNKLLQKTKQHCSHNKEQLLSCFKNNTADEVANYLDLLIQDYQNKQTTNKITTLRREMNLESASREFKMIDNDNINIIIVNPNDKESVGNYKEIQELMSSTMENKNYREEINMASLEEHNIISVFSDTVKKLVESGKIIEFRTSHDSDVLFYCEANGNINGVGLYEPEIGFNKEVKDTTLIF